MRIHQGAFVFIIVFSLTGFVYGFIDLKIFLIMTIASNAFWFSMNALQFILVFANMYKHHRFEFRRTKKSMIAYFLIS